MFKVTRTKPVCVVTSWNNIDRNTLSILLQFIDNISDFIRMEIVCKRWRDIMCKDKEIDKSHWKRLVFRVLTNKGFIDVERTPEIIEWYVFFAL